MKAALHSLQMTARGIDLVTAAIGRVIPWLAVVMMILTCLVVFLRYVLQTGSIATQETVTYCHAILFMLGASYTLQRGGHVRVDILYRNFAPQKKAWVDLAGSLLLLIPVSILIFVVSLDYVTASWSIRESSVEPSGLPWVYLLKTLLLIMPLTLIAQGIAEAIKSILTLAGIDTPHPDDRQESHI